VEDDVQHLRRSLRDIVAFTMLPSVWTGSTTAQICADVIDVVSRAIDCDAVHLSLQSSVSADLLRLRDEDDAETRRAMRELAGQPPRHDVQAVAAAGRPDLRVIGYPLSADPADRLIVASYRADFPAELERLMLRVAANQASLWIERKKVEAALHEANRAKDEFLANLSHELRTPMTAILGWAHLLEMGDLEEPQARLGIATIKQSAQAQAKLIDDLLDVSRIITGKLYLNSGEVDLAEIVRNATAAIRPAIHAKRQQLDLDLGLDLGMEHVTVWGDAGRLQQVFWNLFANAVKFTPPGGSIRVQLGADGDGHVTVSIRDTGEGIAAEFLPLVFDRFRQAATIHRGRTGLGLGLAITKELVEMHGGSISAASEGEGHGSTFTVVLPRYSDHQPLTAPALVQSRSSLQSLRILLVEDDEGTRTLLEALLNAFGAEVTAASCAADAEGVFEECRPQVLITDIGMPDGDGLMLLQRLRTRQPALPAIAVSGYAETATRDRVLSVGFNGFITKPVDPMALIEAIELSFRESRPSP
jgi:signal transduction histidine kinase/CheY-like chemotaxis protein